MSAKYGMVFGLMASAAALVGREAALPARLLAGWSALSFGVMAVVYLGGGVQILGKRPDGRRAAWAWPLLGPYFALNGAGFALYRLSRRGDRPDPIAPGVWLGRRMTAAEARRAGMPPWASVLDLAAEFAEARPLREGVAYRSIPVLDGTAPASAELSEAVAWLMGRAGSGPILIHCALGHGRSATVAAAYLMAAGLAPDAASAMARIREARPGVAWNPAQARALAGFAPPA
ncbi:dual specificity protein phosphatase family protein [Tundrisphaera sp. TA3]|uniref:dual specificity protein phosphatase family protein n=1 Tax=Tundrisphaera sp. TA3 TaxID=3435775 RepID=UPI003EB8FB12